MLVHSRELATLQSLHPMQWAWYVEGGLGGVDPAMVVTFDGDIELGRGITLLWTPGHTDGNHSLVVNTPDGVWVSSENGISLDNWQPELSRIPVCANTTSNSAAKSAPMPIPWRILSISTIR